MTETSEQQQRGDGLARRLAEALGVEYVPPPVQLPPPPAPHLLRDVESSSFDRRACEGAGQLAVGRPGPNGWLRNELVRFAEAIATDDQVRRGVRIRDSVFTFEYVAIRVSCFFWGCCGFHSFAFEK